MWNFWKRGKPRTPFAPPARFPANAPAIARDDAANQGMSVPPPAKGFRLLRYFTLISLAAFALVAAALLYLKFLEIDFFEQMQQEQNAFVAQMHDGFAKRHDATTQASLLMVHEAGSVNLTRLLANALWKSDFAPFVAKAQRIPVDQCRAIADVQDAGGRTAPPGEKQACFAEIGKKIMARPEFRALDAKTRDMMKKSTVFKVKVYDLRGITVYSSERSQIGEDKRDNAGWQSAVAGKPASQLTHRGKFGAFEGVVSNRDLIESYIPALSPGSEQIAGVFEIYSDVTPFLNQIKNTSTQLHKLSAENDAQVRRAAAANQGKVEQNAKAMLAVAFGLLALFYCGLLLIVHNGQRILDNRDFERREAETQLRNSEQRYRQIIETSIDGFRIVGIDGRVLEVNDAYCRMSGYSRDALLSMRISDVEAEERREETARHMQEVMTIGYARFETRHRRKDGQFLDIEVNTVYRPDQEDGRFFAFLHDITERKRQAQLLQESENRFRGLVEQSIAGIYMIQDGKFAYVNPRFAEIFGYPSADEPIGLDASSVVAEAERTAVVENIRQWLKGGTRSISYSTTALRKDRSTIEVGVHATRGSHGSRPAILGLIQDISEKKRAEEQAQRYLKQLKTAFMSTVEVATTLSEMRDPYTAGHERRVGKLAAAIGAELGFDEPRIEGLLVAGYLHDIGKITIPAEILSKPGKLSPIEFQLIQAHAQAGYDVLKDVAFPWPVAAVALQHHERMDGSGYPQGLKGESIQLEARIMAVADVVEAMSSPRPYRPGLGIDAALAEIERGSGSAYDPTVADACLKLFREKGYALSTEVAPFV